MSNHQYILSDIDFQQLQQSDGKKSSPAAAIKEEDIPREDMFFFSQAEMQSYNGDGNFEGVGNTLSIPDNSAFNIPFTDEQMNQLLMSTQTDETYTKIPIDFGTIFKLNGVKTEMPMATSHFVKYKADENGKHIKIWECGICHKEFGHQYILMRHLPTHTDERKFQCKQCGKAFRQMSTLSQHRAIHSKLRPYVCEVCQKTFNRVSTLISHRKTHTGLKPHRCHLCNKAFHQKGNLRNHIFTHTNERPYKCDVCHKGFNQMSNLMCHKLKAHQRADKPKYNCQTCGKEFQKRIGLRNHEQYEHGEAALPASAVNVNIPSVKYTNGVLVSPITTAAMKHAVATNQVPFALLRPLNGIPVLVRVLPAGDKQMLVPATAEDLKKFGEITIKKKEEDDKAAHAIAQNNASTSSSAANNSPNPAANREDDKKGATVQIRIPVVASVVQRCRDGTMHMDIESPGPRREGQDESYVFTTTDEAFNKQDLFEGDADEEDDDTLASSSIDNKIDAELEIEEIVMNGDGEDSSNEMRFFDLTSLAEDSPPKRNGIVLQDFSIHRDAIEIFDPDMGLSLNTPIINLDDDQSDVVLEEIIPNEIFSVTDSNSSVPIYEIIETSEDGTIQNAEKLLRAFDNSLYHRQSRIMNDDEFEISVD